MRSPLADLRRLARRLLRPSPPAPRGGEPFEPLARLHARYGRDGDAPAVLCLGDSVLERVAREDADQRSLGAMLEHELPCTVVSHSAYHPQIYLQLLRALERMPRRPRVVVVPINIRCFSPQWDFHPEFQFAAELAALDRYIADPSNADVMIDFEPTAQAREAYARQPVDYPGSRCTTIGDFIEIRDHSPEEHRDRRLAAIFEFHYMHPLQREQRKLRSLVGLASLLTAHEARSFFYLTPINHEAGVRHCGPAFDERFASNVTITTEALRPFVGERLAFANLGRLAPSSEFVQPDIGNEHLNERGRARLAAEVVSQVRALL